jgi:hypothetical protein
MDARSELHPALEAAVEKILRSLFRVLVRHAISFTAFEELAKKAYVEVTMQDFAIEGKKPSISRASILSGLTRKEVRRLVQGPASDPQEAGMSPAPANAGRYNRAARVLTAWLRDPDLQDRRGQPRQLPLEGPQGFAELVRRHSGDMPVRAVLDELLRVGAVQLRDDRQVKLVTRAYVPARSAPDKLEILGQDVADLIATIDHNIQHGSEAPHFQRKVMYHRIPVKHLPALSKLGAEQGQRLLERLDRWLDQRQLQDRDTPTGEGARVGVGIYYFEERESPLEPQGASR